MKLNLKIRNLNISKNFEFFFVLLLILISIFITQLYNSSKRNAQNEYIKIFNNLYFQKTVKNIFDNLPPKYLACKLANGKPNPKPLIIGIFSNSYSSADNMSDKLADSSL